MTGQIVLRRHFQNQRCQSLLVHHQQSKKNQKLHLAEVAGGTTAECAAICCCCPCGLVNLFIVAVYKLPTGLCKKALKKKKLHSFKKSLIQERHKCEVDEEKKIRPIKIDLWPLEKPEKDSPTAAKIEELEKEMWERFHNTGFWRSPSQRE
ncbi:hypothetical protein NE237_004847 [Protea cynaroides]|uniref:Uncharacterized protein n=1 Tax=Protea cynaroides TaxID=273540 RepID=A0A9Q0KJD2_9MAGN|nr:hypothetical protein NE237_004847 [Protea cynaroides]